MGDDATADRPSAPAAVQLAHEIKRLRKAADISQPDLAGMIGYTRQYVSLAERVGKNIPSQELIRALDKALNANGALIALWQQAKAEQAALRQNASAAEPLQPDGYQMSSPGPQQHAVAGSTPGIIMNARNLRRDDGRRACGGCGALLAWDNTGHLCSRCVREQRDQLRTPPTHLPDDFWETDDFRAAFESQHIGKVFKVYRNHPRHRQIYGKALNQGTLGRWLRLEQSQVSRIESAPKPELNTGIVWGYAQILHIPRHLLWFRPPGEKLDWHPARTTPRDSTTDHSFKLSTTTSGSDSANDEETVLDSLNRRTLIAWGATSAAAYIVSEKTRSIGIEDVSRLKRKTVRLHRLDQRYGSDGLWHSAISYATESYRLLENGVYADSVGSQLLKATGELQICGGWLAFDAGEHAAARSCYTEALGLARQANDAVIEIRALANLAFQSNTLNKPREGLRLATAAAQVAATRTVPPYLQAIPHLRIAVAHSLMGNHQDSTQAIAIARRALEKTVEEPGEAWNTFLTQTEIDAVEATCALELDESNKAERLFLSSIDGHVERNARNRSLYRVRLAKARLGQGEPEGAVEALSPALDELSAEISSWRVGNELHAVGILLKKGHHIPAVDAFVHRLDEVADVTSG